jgi:hypothetical protein
MSTGFEGRAVGEAYFRELLGVSPAATRQEIRQAYRRLVMENHPDRFPPEDKALQERKLITMTDAYTFLMSGKTTAERTTGAPRGPRTHPVGAAGTAVGVHKDPAYAYYKQGFINYSVAIRGIADTNRKIAQQKRLGFRPYRVAQDFSTRLSLLNAAYGYFTRVVEEYPECVWVADARMKLSRIQGLVRVYNRILSNLKTRKSRKA